MPEAPIATAINYLNEHLSRRVKESNLNYVLGVNDEGGTCEPTIRFRSSEFNQYEARVFILKKRNYVIKSFDSQT